MDKKITVLGYKNFITEMSDAPDCCKHFKWKRNFTFVSKIVCSRSTEILCLHVNTKYDFRILQRNESSKFLWFSHLVVLTGLPLITMCDFVIVLVSPRAETNNV